MRLAGPADNSRRRMAAVARWTRRYIVHAVAVTVAVGFISEVLREVLVGQISSLTEGLIGRSGSALARAVARQWRLSLAQHPDLPLQIAAAVVILGLAAACAALGWRLAGVRGLLRVRGAELRDADLRLAQLEAEMRELADGAADLEARLRGRDEELARESEFRLALVAMEDGWKWTLAVNSRLSAEAKKAELVSWVIRTCDELLKGASRPLLRIAYLECRYRGRAIAIPVPEERDGTLPAYELGVVGTPIRLDESAELDVRSFGSERGIVNRAVLSGEQRHCPDVTRVDLPDCAGYVPSTGTGHQFRSIVCEPVILRHGIRGVICVDGEEPDGFNKRDLQVLEHLAGKIGLIYTLLEA